MAIRVKWDQHETALLIDTFWKIEANPTDKKKLIEELSRKLRRKAVLAGIEIDDVYRNENGIAMQLSPIGHAFFPDRPTLTSSAMFERMVKLYKEERSEFDRILHEANNMLYEEDESEYKTTRQEKFSAWLTERGLDPSKIKAISEAIDYCSDYSLRRKLSNVSFWDMDDDKEFFNIGCKLLGIRLFRLSKKDIATKFYSSALPLYKKFLFENNGIEESPAQKPAVAEHVTEKVHASSESVENSDAIDDRLASDSKTICTDKEHYYRWLIDNKGVTEATSRGYVSAINSCEEQAQYISLDYKLFSANEEVIRRTAKALFEDDEFRKINEKQHNRYVISLRHFLEFANIEIEQTSNQISMHVHQNKGLRRNVDEVVFEVLKTNYPYGFNVGSPIELMRFKKKYEDSTGSEVEYEDDRLSDEIKKCGIEHGGKIYVVSEDAINRVLESLRPFIETGIMAFYYEEIYNQNESWLFEEKIISADMLKEILEVKLPTYQYKQNYFIARSIRINEREALASDIITVWGENVLRSFDELHESLPFTPLDKIKYALASVDQFVWNSFETYTLKDRFKCTDEQLKELRNTAAKLCGDKGSATFEELPVSDLIAENFELSETSIVEIIFSLLSDEYDRNHKAITKKGEKVDLQNAIINYCVTKDQCTFSEVEEFSQNTVGEVRYPVLVEAIHKAMIRVDYDNFVSDGLVTFDIDGIDNALDAIIKRNVIGLKEINSFGAFPYCGYQWNLYLLESFCRRFSKKFKYDCATANSKNAGAIIRKSFLGNYHEAMAEAVAFSSTKLNESEVFDYLISSGLMMRRQYSEMSDLLNKASILREGR